MACKRRSGLCAGWLLAAAVVYVLSIPFGIAAWVFATPMKALVATGQTWERKAGLRRNGDGTE